LAIQGFALSSEELQAAAVDPAKDAVGDVTEGVSLHLSCSWVDQPNAALLRSLSVGSASKNVTRYDAIGEDAKHDAIVQHLKRTRIVKLLAEDDPDVSEWKRVLAAELPDVHLVPVRSIGADTASVRFGGERYLVWDTRLIELVETFTKIVILSSRFAPSDLSRLGYAFCLDYVADRLFDEGLPVDAWMVMTGARTLLGGESPEALSVPEDDQHVISFVNQVQRDFLFFHEVAHLMARSGHPGYKAARDLIDERAALHRSHVESHLSELSQQSTEWARSRFEPLTPSGAPAESGDEARLAEETWTKSLAGLEVPIIREEMACDLFAVDNALAPWRSVPHLSPWAYNAIRLCRFSMNLLQRLRDMARRHASDEEPDEGLYYRDWIRSKFLDDHLWLNMEQDKANRIVPPGTFESFERLEQRFYEVYMSSFFARTTLEELNLAQARAYRGGYSSKLFGAKAYDHAFLRSRGWDEYVTDSDVADLFLDKIPHASFSIGKGLAELSTTARFRSWVDTTVTHVCRSWRR
jgi:hypothetical protein